MKVLIIDDDAMNRKFVGNVVKSLSENGEIIFAESGVEGLKVFKNSSTPFDVVFTDRQMPGMLGEKVVREIKKISPQTRVIFMSGDDQREVSQVAEEAGADKILFKPFGVKELRQALSE